MNTSGLLDFQAGCYPMLLAALLKHGAALDGSSMGIGKTYVAAAVIRDLALPTLVVAPKVTLSAWERVLQQMGTEASLINYELVGRRAHLGHWLPLTGRQRYPRFRWSPEIEFLVFDEIHRAKGLNTDNSFFVRAARDCGIPALGLSATIAQNPLELQATAYLLRLYDVDFFGWARRNGCRRGHFGGLEFVRAAEPRQAALKRLHAQLFPEHGIRIRAEDLGTFPETQITAELYNAPDAAAIEQSYKELEDDPEAFLEHPGTRALHLRMEIELAKVPVFASLAFDAMEQGYSVVIFMNHTEATHKLASKLRTRAVIDGTQVGAKGLAEREEIILNFQENKIPLVICNVQAGGVGLRLHDEHGGHPRFVLHSPTFRAFDFRQATGRVQSASAKTKNIQRVVLAAKTCEVHIKKELDRKLENLDLLNDGDLTNLPK
jgi:hypothetical protein